MNVLEISELTKIYGETRAVGGVSFSVRRGEIVGLLGPNGAGKTTIINMVLAVLEPTAGRIMIDGIDIAVDRSQALERTNFAAVYAQLPGNLTVRQNLTIFGMLYGVERLAARVDEVMQTYGLLRFEGVRCGVLSSGEQTRVSLAKAVINRPRLLLLDEPTASMDPATAQTMRADMRAFARAEGAGILWTSHNMYEVESVCDRVLFLSHGKILLEGDPRRLPETNGVKNLEELFIKVAREPLSIAG